MHLPRVRALRAAAGRHTTLPRCTGHGTWRRFPGAEAPPGLCGAFLSSFHGGLLREARANEKWAPAHLLAWELRGFHVGERSVKLPLPRRAGSSGRLSLEPSLPTPEDSLKGEEPRGGSILTLPTQGPSNTRHLASLRALGLVSISGPPSNGDRTK